MQLPLAYLDPAAIEEVSIPVWREVFDTVGWPASLTAIRDSFQHAEILRAFAEDPPSDSLLQALEALDSFGTEHGREAIMTAVQDRGVAPGAVPASASEREFALQFFVAQRKDASLADAFVRAQIQVQERRNERRYHEFMGKESRTVKTLTEKKGLLRSTILDFCQKSDLGDHVQVDAFEDDGIYVFNILRSHRTQKPLAIVRGHSARATIEFRPVHGDVVRYDSSVGRLRIAARASSIVEFYRETFGKILFGDAAFFGGDPVCSLQVLQEHGREALENHQVYGIGRIWMTECLWERGDRELFHIRSNDCFRSMEELRLPLSEGTLVQAKLKCEVIGRSTRPVTINIRVPSRIEVSQKAHEELIDRVLGAIGIRSAAPISTTMDLWSLAPWRHPVEMWRALLGTDADRMVVEQALKPIQLAAVPHPDHLDAGRALEAHAVSAGDFYGVSRESEIPSRSLTATDLDGLELQPEAFRLYLRKRLGITNGGMRWDSGDLLELGFVEIADQRIYTVYTLRRPGPGVGDVLRAHAGGSQVLLLFPTAQTGDAELAHVALETPLPSRQELIRQAVCACGLDGAVPALYTAPERARLVVDNRIGKVWVDGVEITDLPKDSHAFRFIELLARRSPILLTDIVAQISPGRDDDTTAALQAKRRVKELIIASVTATGRPFDEDLFPTAGTGLYRCAVAAYVR